MALSFTKCFSGFAVIALLVLVTELHAQNSTWNTSAVTKKTEGAKHKVKDYKKHLENWGTDTSYNRAFLIGGKLNSDGWSGCMDFIKRKNYKINKFWQISFSEIKHEKQTKQQGTNSTYPQLGNATPYVFGKINNLYTFQVGFGKEKLLLQAVLDGNLSVSYRYSGGLSLAMLKPYYLKLIYIDNGGASAHLEQYTYNQSDSAYFLNPNSILGASKWTTGLGNIDYVPGVYFETSIAIIPGKNKYFIQVVTLGINGACYAKQLPVLIDQVALPWQVSLFASFAIGERWK